MEDLLSLAKKMADDMPENEKQKLQTMDFNSMFGSVYQNVMKQIAENPDTAGMADMFKGMAGMPGMPGGIDGGLPKIDENEVPVKKSAIRFSEENSDNSENESDDEEDVISQKSRDLHYNLNVKLEDLYNGKQKKISFHRKRFKETPDDKTGKRKYETFEEKKKLIINIRAGMSDGDNITFKGESDQLPGETAGDVIITICEDEHDVFDRENDNIFLVKDISLSELYSTHFSLTHMDGRVLDVSSKPEDYLHTNDGIRKIKGEGMPIDTFGSEKGDLFIRFNLVLPDKLELSQVELLSTIAPPLNKTIEDDKAISYVLDIVTEEDMEKLENENYDSEDENSEDENSEDENSEDEDDIEENSDEDKEDDIEENSDEDKVIDVTD